VLALPAPTETMLLWFVREAWPSPATGTSLTEGFLDDSELCVDVESDGLVAFGDGMESDSMQVTWGQTVRLDVAPQHLRLVN
jgi:hypothetical protein